MVSFEQFVHDHGTALLRFTCLLTADHHAGQDLAQTALVHALRHWRKVTTSANPQAYLRKVALNAHIDATRRRSSTETLGHHDDIADPASAHLHQDRHAPGADACLLEREDLHARLAGLAPRAREVLVLRYYADLDDAAIAAAMGTSTSTVRATISRALAALRETPTTVSPPTIVSPPTPERR